VVVLFLREGFLGIPGNRRGDPGAQRRTEVSRLSSGVGNAQGGLDLADGQVWATWQEHDPLKDGRFRTRIYAAELSPTGRVKRKIRLWRGLSIGPGSIQVLAFQGETLALFMRGSSNGHGLQVTVRTLNLAG
jgi:hypothetical protein